MRILVAALGSPGHAFPLVPLATALRDAGHDVAFAVGEDVEQAIASTGLAVVRVGGGLRSAFQSVVGRRGLPGQPRDQATTDPIADEVFGEVLPRRVLDDLERWLAAEPVDLVVAELSNAGACLAAAAHGVPCVLHSFGRRPPSWAPMSARAGAAVAALAAERGLDLVQGDALGHAYVDICPPALQDEPTGGELPEIAMRPVAWNPPGSATPRPRAGRPWAYLTLGTAMGSGPVLRAAATGLTRVPVDVLVAGGSVPVDELGDLAPGGEPSDARILVEPFVAQAELFAGPTPPALVVHHGGSGTTFAAAAAGIPQLFLPQGADQYLNAAAVTEAGAGATLGETSDPEAVTSAARELLGSGPAREAARALADQIAAMPEPAEVAARVEDWGVPIPESPWAC